MLSCKETVLILSSSQELTFRQKLELRAHLFMCKHCSAYSNQLKKSYQELTKTDPDRVHELENKVLENLKRSNISLRSIYCTFVRLKANSDPYTTAGVSSIICRIGINEISSKGIIGLRSV